MSSVNMVKGLGRGGAIVGLFGGLAVIGWLFPGVVHTPSTDRRGRRLAARYGRNRDRWKCVGGSWGNGVGDLQLDIPL